MAAPDPQLGPVRRYERWVTATIGTLAGKQTGPVGPPRVKRNRQSVRPPVKRTPFDTTLLGYGPVSEGLRADLDASLAQIQRDYVALAE